MNLEFETAVENCIALMQSGATLDSCLERYPQYARELQPVLRTARALQALIVPQERTESVQAGRQRLLNAYAKKAAAQPVSESSIPRFIQRILIKLTGKDDIDMKLVARFAMAILLVIGLLFGGGITTTASASALPGDTLYPLKLSLEDLRLLFANDPQVHQQLEHQYQDTRQQEVQSLLQLGRQTGVHFVGVLSAVNPDSWIIGGLPVKLDGATQIVGAATPGSIVNIEGETRSDGSILAHTLTVEGQANNPTVPTTSPSHEPTHEPTFEPTHELTHSPTHEPEHEATHSPTHEPSHQATMMPTPMPNIYLPTTMPSHDENQDGGHDSGHDGGHDGGHDSGGMHH